MLEFGKGWRSNIARCNLLQKQARSKCVTIKLLHHQHRRRVNALTILQGMCFRAVGSECLLCQMHDSYHSGELHMLSHTSLAPRAPIVSSM